jgi:hypothetical protein
MASWKNGKILRLERMASGTGSSTEGSRTYLVSNGADETAIRTPRKYLNWHQRSPENIDSLPSAFDILAGSLIFPDFDWISAISTLALRTKCVVNWGGC